jgi:hypothetical protein
METREQDAQQFEDEPTLVSADFNISEKLVAPSAEATETDDSHDGCLTELRPS